MKQLFDNKAQAWYFQEDYLDFSMGKINEQRSKNGMFDNLWLGPFLIDDVKVPNYFLVSNL